ncbi:MAG TPA: protein kinase [Candidatus Acidoferrales bacterium]
MTDPTPGKSPDSPNPHEPKNTPEREQRLAAAVAEYLDLLVGEEEVDADGFCRGHADLEPDLRFALQSLDEIDRMTNPKESRSADDTAEALPQTLSGHRVVGEIGAGGMGRVYLAEDERLGRRVAIKTLNSRYSNQSAVRGRFMKEARALAQLSHPNIVHIYNLGAPDEPPHFVMEFLEGVPLTQAAKHLALKQKVELMYRVVRAVEYLHEHQIVHRDLKPGNILVGADLEPKLLDFGLALEVSELGARLTLAGEVLGTPEYFSPEQTCGDSSLDERSDIFSLGTILYELLTGSVPFRGESFQDLLDNIRQQDPRLPRRFDQSIPGSLQDICLKALEKNPVNRYASAREMADDLERYLSGEPILGVPLSYARLIKGRIEQHMRELRGWAQDHLISEAEYDALRKGYDRLIEREDAWILQVRRLSPSQVSLYLGAWVLVVGAALIFLFEYPGLKGTPAVLVVSAATAPTAYLGIRLWKEGRFRIGVAYLLAVCLLLPVVMLVAMGEYHFFTQLTQGRQDLEIFSKVEGFKNPTNAQLWWAIFLSLPSYLWLRRFTRSSVYSLVCAVMGALLCIVTLFRMGMVEWFEKDPGKPYFRLIPFAALFFVVALALERLRKESDSRYFYPVAVFFAIVALSGVAGLHKPYAKWLESAFPWTRGQVEYFFIVNAAIYGGLNLLCESFHTPQMRAVAKSFRFLIPGHVMTSLLLLGLQASKLWDESTENLAYRHEARIFEFLLPAVACFFVFGSIPKQMKNFFVSGLVFVAIGIVRLQQDFYKDRAGWPIFLVISGIAFMVAATWYAGRRISFPSLKKHKP